MTVDIFSEERDREIAEFLDEEIAVAQGRSSPRSRPPRVIYEPEPPRHCVVWLPEKWVELGDNRWQQGGWCSNHPMRPLEITETMTSGLYLCNRHKHNVLDERDNLRERLHWQEQVYREKLADVVYHAEYELSEARKEVLRARQEVLCLKAKLLDDNDDEPIRGGDG